MKTILTAVLAFICLQASSQCASQTVIQNPTFQGPNCNNSNSPWLVLGAGAAGCGPVSISGGIYNGPGIGQQLNLPLVNNGTEYTGTIVIGSGSGTCECHVWGGWSLGDESGQEIWNSGNCGVGSGTYTFTFHPLQNYTYISIMYNYLANCGGSGGGFVVNSFTLSSAATPLVLTAQTSNSCYGDSTGTALIHATGYSPFTYHWNNGQSDSLLQNVPSGTYDVTVRDSMGCVVNDTVAVGSFSFATASINYNGNTLTSTSESSYQWYFNGSIINGSTNQTYAPTQNGDYYVVVTDANGCTLQSNTIYVGNAITCTTPFVFIYPPSESICSGGSQTLTLIGNGVNYSWSNGSTATQITVSPTSTNTYSVTATDGNCSASASASITVTNSPSFGIYPVNPVICTGIPVNISVSASGTAYMWSGPNNFTANTASVSINSIGQYDITVTNPSGCVGTFSTAVNVTQGAPPTISAGNNQTINLGDTTNLIATVSNGTPPYTYEWSSNPAGFTSSSPNPQIIPTVTTTYNLTVTETDGCAATASTIVTISNTSQCDTSIHPVITAIGCSLAVQQYSGATYQWEQNGAVIPSATTAFYNVTQTDYYTCSVEINTCTYFSNNAYFAYNLGNCTPAAIQSIDAINLITIMPNPSFGEFTLAFEIPGTNNAELKIFNTLGELVLGEELGSVSGRITKQINLQKAAEGIYILQLRAGDKMISRKIIVE